MKNFCLKTYNPIYMSTQFIIFNLKSLYHVLQKVWQMYTIIWKQLSRTSDKHKDKTIWMLISWGWILKDRTTDFNNFHRFCPLQAERTASVQSCFCPDWLHHSEVYWIPALRSVKYGSPIHLIVFLIKKTNTILINFLWLNIRLSIELII